MMAAEGFSADFCEGILTSMASKASEVHSGSYSIPAATVFAFGIFIMEVRPSYLVTSSVGGGAVHDLNSA